MPLPIKSGLSRKKLDNRKKTMQNAIGVFHQEILESIRGWKNMGAGGGLDVRNREGRIIAEVKNKFNTTKGNHKVEVYDAIKSMLKTKEYEMFTGYYVEIISQGKKKDNEINFSRRILERSP